MDLNLSLKHFSVDFEDIPFLIYFGCFVQNSYGALVDRDGFIVFTLAFQNEGHGGQFIDLIVDIDRSCHVVGRKILDSSKVVSISGSCDLFRFLEVVLVDLCGYGAPL